MCLCLIVSEVLGAVNIPVLVGSGVTIDNFHQYRQAHAVIVGSHFKRQGHWENSIDEARLQAFIEKVEQIRRSPTESTMIM